MDPDDNDDAEVDKADDLSPTVGVWTLNDATWPRVKFGGGGGGGGGLRHGDLLSLVLQRAPLQHTIAVIALDLSAPWDVLPAAQAWLAALSAAMAPVLAALPLGEQDALRRAVRDHVASYGSRSSGGSGGGGGASEAAAMADPAGRSSSAGEGEDGSGAAALAAAEGGGAASMSENLGLPVVLLCTKSDVLAGTSSGAGGSALPGQQEQEQEQQGGERLDPHVVATRHDFLQLQLRRLALRYGAALVYTSARDGTNCAALHRYLLHRLYPEGGTTVAVTPPPPQAVERAAVLVPSGWDSPELIGDAPGGWSFDTPFEKVWPRPEGAFSAVAAAAAAEEEEDAPQATTTRPEVPLDVPRVDEQGWLAEMRQLQEKEAGASGAAAGGRSSTEPRSASQLISGVFGSKESGAAAAAPAATGAAGDAASAAAGGSSSGLARKASRAADVNQKDLQNFFSNLLTRPNNRKASSATLEQDKLARLKAEKALSSLKK